MASVGVGEFVSEETDPRLNRRRIKGFFKEELISEPASVGDINECCESLAKMLALIRRLKEEGTSNDSEDVGRCPWD